jgi:hypothetical protein
MNKIQRTFLIVLAAVLVPLSALAVIQVRSDSGTADPAAYRRVLQTAAPAGVDYDMLVSLAEKRCKNGETTNGFLAARLADNPDVTDQVWNVVQLGFDHMCPSKSAQWSQFAAKYGH